MTKAASRIFSDIIDPSKDRPTFDSIHKISDNHHDKHMLDVGSLACGLVSALKYHVKNGNHGDNYWEWAKTDGSYASYLLCAKKQVTFPYGIYFDKTSPNWSKCAIDNAYRVTTQIISYQTNVPYSDISLKENVRYLDASAMPAIYSNDGSNVYKENLETRDYSNEDLLEKTDLYDFIVNQVNICEYNFINDDTKQIGFIANEYEDTKVGDRLLSRNEEGTLTYNANNLLFATIGALQEEVRTKDEKIASLEARLAKIEAMLGIDNE
jgi:hypothetical protein